MELQENASRPQKFNEDVSPTPPVISFPRPAWVRLIRLRTGIGLFRSERHKWGMASTAACDHGTKAKKAEHVIISCSI